jgi:hypothetical protein
MRTRQFLSIDRPALAGLFLLAIPFSFWIAVIFEQVFNNPFLVNSIFVTIDNISPLLSILLLVVLPLIALAWNLLHIITLSFKFHEGEFITTLSVKTRLLSIGVIAGALINITLIGCYVLLENFNITLR